MKITGNRIMELLGAKNKTKFVRTVFDPLKNQGDADVYDSWHLLDKERSQLMAGKKVNSHSTFVTWADRIKLSEIYRQLIDKIAVYRSENEEQLRSFREMFEEDRSDKLMPRRLADKIERKFEQHEDCEAILLLFLWSIFREDISLLSFLYTEPETPAPQKRTVPDEARLLPHIISANPVYIGHERLIREIRDKLMQNAHFVFLQGMGGIGKTESAKQYAKRYAGQYDTVVFAECNSSLTELLNDNTVFTLTKPFESERFRNLDGVTETDAEYYQRKLSALRCAVSDRTLLILDNVDTQDPMLPDFLTGICHVIITTRWQSQLVYPEETLMLDEINDQQDCRAIFSAYYGKDTGEDPFVEKIIAYFSGHTLALELTAKQMRVSNLSPEEMWDVIASQNESELEEGFLLPNKGGGARSMTRHIRQIFNVTHLRETDRYILSCLSLMPKSGLNKKYVRDFCGCKSYTALNELIQRSWLREIDCIVTMHTLIKETVQITCQPTLHSCMPFIRNLIKELSALRCYYAEYSRKAKIYQIAAVLYDAFPEPDMETSPFYEWAELVFSHFHHPLNAKALAEKLHALYQQELGDNHFKTARMICRIGCDERGGNHMEHALELLKRGREVLRQLPEKSRAELMYLSDVDVIVSDLLLFFYQRHGGAALLDEAEAICMETIEIRSMLQPYYDIGDKNCLSGYRDLARVAIQRNRLEEAERYLQSAENVYLQSHNEVHLYYLDYGKAELELARGNDQKAIAYLEEALACRKRYFGSGSSGDTTSHVVNVQIELGKLYEKVGEPEKALAIYKTILETIQQLPFYQNETQMIASCIAELE